MLKGGPPQPWVPIGQADRAHEFCSCSGRPSYRGLASRDSILTSPAFTHPRSQSCVLPIGGIFNECPAAPGWFSSSAPIHGGIPEASCQASAEVRSCSAPCEFDHTC